VMVALSQLLTDEDDLLSTARPSARQLRGPAAESAEHPSHGGPTVDDSSTLGSARRSQFLGELRTDAPLLVLLRVAVVVMESGWLANDVHQLRVTGVQSYLGDGFNWTNVIASCSLIYASITPQLGQSVAHLRTAGSIGVAFKWCSLLEYFRCFPTTGPPIRMIFEIIIDIWPLMIILAVTIVGTSLAFAIDVPSSAGFDLDSELLGPAWPLMTVWLMVLGSITVSDLAGNSSAFLIFFVFSFFVMVLLLNLLIAVMGDSYEKVKEYEVIEDLRSRAMLIADVERRFHIPVLDEARYVHFAEATHEEVIALPRLWEGVSGKVKQEIDRVKADVDKVSEALESLGEKLEQRFEKLEGLMEANMVRLLKRTESGDTSM